MVPSNTFDKLLDGLSPDKKSAALEYRKLHERLSRFFEWNSAADPAALADEAIDRLAKRMAEGTSSQPVRNPSAFTLGIARLLLQEEARRQQREIETLRTWEMHNVALSTDAEDMSAALQHCLARLSPERRTLVEKYYACGEMKKAKLHQMLADDLGLTINALRNRALRARQDLEGCMRKYLEKYPSDVSGILCTSIQRKEL
jgi:DNA-directed RNA polymerase specialized sigma24 family protein